MQQRMKAITAADKTKIQTEFKTRNTIDLHQFIKPNQLSYSQTIQRKIPRQSKAISTAAIKTGIVITPCNQTSEESTSEKTKSKVKS
jgi:hypothetical protein